MDGFKFIELEGMNVKGQSIEFLNARISDEYFVPLAVVNYRLNGRDEELGLRLDMNKRAFLDHLTNTNQEEFLQQSAPKIVKYLSDHMIENNYPT